MSQYPPGHAIEGDGWVCECGYDFFGGSAAYSWQLYEAHTATFGYVWSDR